MDLKTFYLALSVSDREKFAELAGTTTGYLFAHLIRRRKMPRKTLMDGLVRACQHFNSEVTSEQVRRFFYEAQAAA